MSIDPTVAATPWFFATMWLENRWLQRRPDDHTLDAARFERRDTRANLALAVGSVVVPLAYSQVRPHLEVGRGKAAKPLLTLAAAGAAIATVADAVSARRRRSRRVAAAPDSDRPTTPTERDATERDTVERVGGTAAAAAIGIATVVASATWTERTSPQRLWARRRGDLGTGIAAWTLAIVGWDFIYYWNHRLQHETRFLWAIHVVHHSSERYNLSVALRQPVLDIVGIFVPNGLLAYLGVRPRLIELSRSINLVYQYWVHTEAIDTMGPFEGPMNTPSYHRVHHGVNPNYIDRNHGGIFIVWDRLFGTFRKEEERPTYGLTKNLNTFSLPAIAFREYADIMRDIAQSRRWSERLSYAYRGPGWAYGQHARRAVPAPGPTT